MSNYLEYKGYFGTVEYSSEDDILHGRIIGLEHAMFTYEGRSVKELRKDFQNAVDDYIISFPGADIEKPCKGTFNVRIGPDLHVRSVLKAKERGQSLNAFVKKAIQNELKQ